jgi:hypothetical protein
MNANENTSLLHKGHTFTVRVVPDDANDPADYVGVLVSHYTLPDEMESLWGVEPDRSYLDIVSHELADQLLDRLPAAIDTQILRLQLARDLFRVDEVTS